MSEKENHVLDVITIAPRGEDPVFVRFWSDGSVTIKQDDNSVYLSARAAEHVKHVLQWRS